MSAGALVWNWYFLFFLCQGRQLLKGIPRRGPSSSNHSSVPPVTGKDGKGQGPAAKAMKIKTTDWTDKAAMEMLKDDFLKDIINKGGKAVNKSKRMPGYS